MPELIKDKGCPTVAAGAFPWNGPKKALNPYMDPAEVAPVSALSNLITLYAADNEQEQLRREALSNEVWDRYFFNESRDPVLREMEQDQLISRAKMARGQQQFNPDLVIVADVGAQPAHISKPLLERIKYFESLGKPKAYSRYLRETIRPCLERLERVRTSQISASFRFMASHDGLEGLLVMPEMNQEQVKRLPEITGGRLSLLALEQMAELGKSWPLIEGSGTIYGMFVIESLSQTKTEFFESGMPRRIEFTLTLKRVDESLSDMFGSLSDQLSNLQDTATSAIGNIKNTVGGLLQ